MAEDSIRLVPMKREHWEALWIAQQGRPQALMDASKVIRAAHDLCAAYEDAKTA